MPREIITLQVGNFANHVGTHIWNLQNSIKDDKFLHDVTWRQNLDGGYQPRVVIIDEESNLGNLEDSGGSIYADNDADFQTVEKNLNGYLDSKITESTWEGQEVSFPKRKWVTKQVFDTDSEVLFDPYWPKYTRTYFNHRSCLFPTRHLNSVQSINISEKNPSEEQLEKKSFKNWLLAKSLFSKQEFQDDFEDRVRYFAEECDWLEGFSFVTDSVECSGFGGLTTQLSNYLSEDYAKKLQLHFPLSPVIKYDDTDANFQWLAILGKAFQFYNLSLTESNADVLTPLTLPSCINTPSNFSKSINPETDYFTQSAIVASWYETVSSAWRYSDNGIPLSTLAQNLTSGGRKILGTKLCFRDDQTSSNFTNLSGLNPTESLQDITLASLPVARGLKSNNYWSCEEKLKINIKGDKCSPRFLKSRKKKGDGEVVFSDWCCSNLVADKVNELFECARQTPKSILATTSVKFDLEIDEIKEAFLNFADVLENYELQKEDTSSESD